MGELSFSIYVLHTPLIGSVASGLVLLLGFGPAGLFVGFAASMLVLFLLAVPLARLDRWWVVRLNASAALLTDRRRNSRAPA